MIRKRVRNLVGALVIGASALAGGQAARAQAATPAVDLTTAGTGGATNITSGATAALPIFGGMVAVGAVVMGFRKLAH